jgi:phosphatidylglycerophosphatase A
MKRRLLRIWLTFGGLGYSPVAPGTFGSVGATLLLAAIFWVWPFDSSPSTVLLWHLFTGVSILVFWIGGALAANIVIRETQIKDPQFIVLDEAAGQWLTFAFLSPAWLSGHPWVWPLGLVLFRIFDISKMLGIKKLEAMPEGWGVMNDDMLGGLYGGILLAVLQFLT